MIISMAWRNIWRNKARSIIILLSIAIGIFAGLFILSLYKGMMRSRVRTVIDQEYGHIQLHHPLFKADQDPAFVINNENNVLLQINKNPSVRAAGSRSVTQAMVSSSTGSAGVVAYGVDPVLENTLSHLSEKIIEGKGFNAVKHNQVIIGAKLARKLKLRLDKKIVLTLMDTASNIVAGSFRITGIYQTDNAPLDEKQVFLQKQDLNALLGIGSASHEVVIQLHDDQSTDPYKNILISQFPFVLVESWKELSPETQLMVDTMDIYSWIIMLIIFLALAFGVENTMLMAILERTHEIGMMMALGLNKMRLFFLVMVETFLLTLAGTPLGFAASWLFINYLHQHGIDWVSTEKEMMQSFGFKPIIYPVFPWERLIVIVVVVLGTAFLSCLYPARRALNMLPSESMRK